MDDGDLLFCARKIAEQIGFAAPQADTAPREFGAGTFEHADIVREITPAIKHASHGDGTGQIIFKDFARDGFFEAVAAGSRISFGGDLKQVSARCRRAMVRTKSKEGFHWL